MEPTFYHDECHPSNESLKRLKKSMTLDFTPGGSSAKSAKLNNPLQSPDLNLLKLASPELERMIIQANGMVTTTPTPTQILCPKFVTEEQEAYARGFVDALAKLHKSYGEDTLYNLPNFPYTQTSSESLNTPGNLMNSITATDSTLLNARGSTNTQSNLVSAHQSISTTLPPSNHSTVNTNEESGIVKLKEEPQTVPCLGSTPPLSPINMESQERIKLERKRARNRIAARKCRTRKLERIARLEDRVKDLKDQNTELSQMTTTLRDDICKLKQQIIEHVNNGCRILHTHPHLII
ncbi:transcription factor AP-1-like [Octopus vulgaris]|uniref:C-jun proto-oncogene n=2 Tax=Octopus TaxID=6643 RepID=A0A4Y1LT23_OCTVU|nr:transcription factor AP-1 [Octopus sinensis]AWJ58224.1 c-jun proto-oncogene [Octopus vulgaris]CAI9727096.1 transcription factor AP-1-like [Octopus vulgaris]